VRNFIYYTPPQIFFFIRGATALTNLGRLSSRRWQSFPTATDGTPNIIRQLKSMGMRWVGHVACMREERKLYKVLVGKPKGKKRPLGRPRHRWEDGIRMEFREIGWGEV
jgi:hypothetical protein